MGIIYGEKSRQFHLYNGKISYIMTCLPNSQLEQFHYEERLRRRESFGHLLEFAHRDMAPCVYEDNATFSLEHIGQEYLAFGTGDMRYPAYGTRRENGSGVSCFVHKSHTIQEGKLELPGLPVIYVEQDEEVQTLGPYLEDPVAGMGLVPLYTIHENMPVLTRSAQFICRGSEPVCLEWVMNLSLDLPDPCYQVVDLTGAWCRERYVDCHRLHRGVQSIHNIRGHSSHQSNPFICLKWPDAGEDGGEVIGISFVYSGNFLAQAEVGTMDMVRVTMGIHPKGSDQPLCSGEEFQMSEAVMVYSGDSLNGMSQTPHQLYRIRLVRGHWRDRERPTLTNNWEATYMDFDEERTLSIADRARELGTELFVLDNGRSGKRDDDTTSLGDQYPNLHKLPDGIIGLVGKIRDMGMKFGLWFEPEVVSRDSCLYRAHLDWMLGSMDRPMCTGRHQHVLDFSKDQVVEYIGDRMEEILGDGGVSYVKWDMNRSISDLSSAGRGTRYQGTAYHRQIPGAYELYERLTRGFPHALFESCASGGARFDPGILYYAPQGWVSDDTDGVERVKIRYGTSLVYPVSSMGSHVSAIPSHQTQRNVPLTSRAAAIFFGTFGYESDLNLLTEEEQYQVKGQMRFMKEYRRLAQQGRFYRFISPLEGNEVAWIVVSEDENKAIAAYLRFLQPVSTGSERLVLEGLSLGIVYWVGGMDYTSYGDELMSVGPTPSDRASDVRTNPVPQGDYLSRLFLVEAQP